MKCNFYPIAGSVFDTDNLFFACQREESFLLPRMVESFDIYLNKLVLQVGGRVDWS